MNSTAVIIGAMLISPLMGPIIGMGFALGTTNWHLLLSAGRNYLIATMIALITSTCYFLISPLNLEQSEMLLRTQPTIYDVLIAFFGGFAGILATASKQKGNVLPGVAIATALMPPLCTAGFGISEMNSTYVFGAFFLFVINTVFIGMATFLACKLLKMPTLQTEPDKIRKARRIAIAISLVTFLPAVYLGFSLFQKTNFTNNATKFIEQGGVLEDNYLFSSSINYETKTIQLVYGGGSIPDSVQQNIIDRRTDYNLQKATIKIIASFSKPISDINEGLKSVTSQMDEKDLKIQLLTNQFDSFRTQLILRETEYAFTSEFLQIKKVKISNKGDDHYMLFVTPKEMKSVKGSQPVAYPISSQDSVRMNSFVTQKLNAKKVQLKVIN